MACMCSDAPMACGTLCCLGTAPLPMQLCLHARMHLFCCGEGAAQRVGQGSSMQGSMTRVQVIIYYGDCKNVS